MGGERGVRLLEGCLQGGVAAAGPVSGVWATASMHILAGLAEGVVAGCSCLMDCWHSSTSVR